MAAVGSDGKHRYKPIKEVKRFGARHMQACLLFVCTTISGMLSVSMNVALLAMTIDNSTESTDSTYMMNYTTNQQENITESTVKINSTNGVTKYNWDKSTMGFVQSSFIWGDVAVQAIACNIVKKFGGKNLVNFGLFATGIITITIPLVVKWWTWIGFCFGILIQSFCAGLIVPAVHTMIGKWAPPNERTRIGNFIYAGYYVSSIFAFPIYALVGDSSLGWPWIFYLNGAQSILMGFVWINYGSSSPAKHKTITIEEKLFIEKSLEQTDESTTTSKTPWRQIFTSVPFLALIVTQIGAQWSYTVVYFEMTAFYNEGLGMKLGVSGLVSSGGYVLALVLVLVVSWSSDKLINRGFCSTTNMRKIANTLGTWLPALCLLIVVLLPNEYRDVKVYLTVILVGLDAINSCGYWMSHIDLSPNNAGVLISIATLISDLFSLLGPIICGLVLEDPSDIKSWNIIFLLTAGTYFLSNLVFLIFGTAKKQSWDSVVEEHAMNNLMPDNKEN